MPRPPPPPSSNVWIYVAGGIFVVAAIVIAAAVGVMQIMVARAGAGPTNVEQSVVDNLKSKPCALPTTCTKRREGLVTYPVCTKNAPMGPLMPGDYVLVKKGARAYAGYVAEMSPDAEHYVVKEIVGDGADDVTTADLARLCR
jgi:hypothetical protein